MKKARKLFLVLFMLFIFLAAEVVFVRSASKYEPRIDIVYAKTKIIAKTVITEDMLTRKKVNLSMIHRQSLFTPGEIVGKTALTDIEEGEMILKSRIGQVKELPQIKVSNPENRLFTIAFTPDQANGWWIGVDQYVDIIFVPNDNTVAPVVVSKPIPNNMGVPEKPDASENFMKDKVKVLEHIRVAALIDENGKLLSNGERDTLPVMISFEVSPGQDRFLAWAKTRGKLEISSIPLKGKNYIK